jgi:hypothetical protein
VKSSSQSGSDVCSTAAFQSAAVIKATKIVFVIITLAAVGFMPTHLMFDRVPRQTDAWSVYERAPLSLQPGIAPASRTMSVLCVIGNDLAD